MHLNTCSLSFSAKRCVDIEEIQEGITTNITSFEGKVNKMTFWGLR